MDTKTPMDTKKNPKQDTRDTNSYWINLDDNRRDTKRHKETHKRHKFKNV